MKPLPPAFLERMQSLLGNEYPGFLACYDAPPNVGLRVNLLKLSADDFRRLSPFGLEPVPWTAEGFRLTGDEQPGKHPYHAAGLYYLQEPAAMAATDALDPQPGERILDLAASPGGKTTHIASRMKNTGLLLANEIRTKRIPALAANLERWGVRNTLITNEPPERLADRLPGFFDRVLVDAPCSGEGMFRKEPDVRAEWKAEGIAGYAERQRLILTFAARLVRPGGVLVYSTCTFAPEENEAVVASFLDKNRDFALAPSLPPLPGLSSARPEWIQPIRSGPWPGAARIWPHLSPGEGHFIARLERVGGDPGPSIRRASLPVPPRPALEDFNAFIMEHATLDITALNLVLLSSRLYHLPPETPDLSGLRVSSPGWWLGEAKKNRFEPGHALAMALRAADARLRLDLAVDDSRLAAYLRGQPLDLSLPNGWTLVTVDGYPLGWGKAVNGVLKNHYPAGLRVY
ncbi:MAG: RsmB/NOP family class I SAM-dependent RNA methyltransferase [Chloroflexota bacterium]